LNRRNKAVFFYLSGIQVNIYLFKYYISYMSYYLKNQI